MPAPYADSLVIEGPFIHEKLGVFMLRGQGGYDASRLLALHEALEHKLVEVHETFEVHRHEVSNLSGEYEVLLLLGDILRGGRQDRCVGADFPA